MTSCLLSCPPKLFWKGSIIKRKEFATKGSKLFPFKVDPFSERRQTYFDRGPSPKSVKLLSTDEDG